MLSYVGTAVATKKFAEFEVTKNSPWTSVLSYFEARLHQRWNNSTFNSKNNANSDVIIISESNSIGFDLDSFKHLEKFQMFITPLLAQGIKTDLNIEIVDNK